jgi:hypothetical protein
VLIKKQWQKSKKIEKKQDVILHFLQSAKMVYFQGYFSCFKSFDNQENTKKDYLLIYFSEKKDKNGLEIAASRQG